MGNSAGTVAWLPGEVCLIALRDGLYGGSWDCMLADLRKRLNSRPYVFKLFERIRDDIATIEGIKIHGKA
jgi:hypothetical protein